MSSAAKAPTNVSNIGVVMFTVADQDAALAFYTEKLGYEVRGDTHFGENGEMRWLEVAPPGSRARLALNPPMGGEPGGGSIGVGTADVLGEHARLRARSAHRPRSRADAHTRRSAHVWAARPGRQPDLHGGGRRVASYPERCEPERPLRARARPAHGAGSREDRHQ